MAKSNKNRSKFLALITYIIAVLALVAGLILPLDTASLSSIDFKSMPLLQLTGALAALNLLSELPFGIALTPAYDYSVNLFGTSLNVGAIMLLAYALVTLLALILLIPACIAKKRGNGARKIIFVAEIIVLTVLLLACAVELTKNTGSWNLSVYLPFGVTLLMLVIQSIYYYGGSGVIKLVMLLLSLVAVFFTVANVVDNVPALSDVIGKILSKMQGSRPFETTAGLFSVGGKTYYGSKLLRYLVEDISAITPAGDWALTITYFLAIALSVIVCLNLFLDMIGLGKRTNKFMLVCNLIRYIAEFVLIAVLIIMVFTVKGSFGLMLYLIFIIALIQLIIEIVRRSIYKKRPSAAAEAATVPVYSDNGDYADNGNSNVGKNDNAVKSGYSKKFIVDASVKPDKIQDTPEEVVEESAATTAVVAEPAPTVVYNGPVDDFINKLTNEQKLEFSRVFLEKNDSNLSGIPDYVVGGDNARFFSFVFIYFSHVREVVSDGLMNKLYEEINSIS